MHRTGRKGVGPAERSSSAQLRDRPRNRHSIPDCRGRGLTLHDFIARECDRRKCSPKTVAQRARVTSGAIELHGPKRMEPAIHGQCETDDHGSGRSISSDRTWRRIGHGSRSPPNSWMRAVARAIRSFPRAAHGRPANHASARSIGRSRARTSTGLGADWQSSLHLPRPSSTSRARCGSRLDLDGPGQPG